MPSGRKTFPGLAAAGLLGLVLLAGFAPEALAQGPTVQGKSWPPGYFLKYQKITPEKRREILADMAAKLMEVNRAGESLVVKGTAIEPLGTQKKIYDQLTVLDESGLRVVVKNVPNLYYGFTGPRQLMNQNIYLLIKKVQVQEADSLLKEAFVVAGDFHAYAQAYITALQETLGRALEGGQGENH